MVFISAEWGDETLARARAFEDSTNIRGDWQQFGNNLRDYPDWALVAGILWNLEKDAQVGGSAELAVVRRRYEAGDIDGASDLLTPILETRAINRA